MYRSRTVKHSNKKPLLIVFTLVALLLIVAAIWYFFVRETDPTKSYQPEYPNSLQKETKQNDNESATAADDYKNSADTTVPSQETSDKVPVAESGTISITNLSQKDGFVNVLAAVTNFETSKCVYTFTAPDARPVVREVSGTCTGVSIPEVEFEMIGTYTLNATAYSGSEKITTTKDIDIK